MGRQKKKRLNKELEKFLKRGLFLDAIELIERHGMARTHSRAYETAWKNLLRQAFSRKSRFLKLDRVLSKRGIDIQVDWPEAEFFKMLRDRSVSIHELQHAAKSLPFSMKEARKVASRLASISVHDVKIDSGKLLRLLKKMNTPRDIKGAYYQKVASLLPEYEEMFSYLQNTLNTFRRFSKLSNISRFDGTSASKKVKETKKLLKDINARARALCQKFPEEVTNIFFFPVKWHYCAFIEHLISKTKKSPHYQKNFPTWVMEYTDFYLQDILAINPGLYQYLKEKGLILSPLENIPVPENKNNADTLVNLFTQFRDSLVQLRKSHFQGKILDQLLDLDQQSSHDAINAEEACRLGILFLDELSKHPFLDAKEKKKISLLLEKELIDLYVPLSATDSAFSKMLEKMLHLGVMSPVIAIFAFFHFFNKKYTCASMALDIVRKAKFTGPQISMLENLLDDIVFDEEAPPIEAFGMMIEVLPSEVAIIIENLLVSAILADIMVFRHLLILTENDASQSQNLLMNFNGYWHDTQKILRPFREKFVHFNRVLECINKINKVKDLLHLESFLLTIKYDLSKMTVPPDEAFLQVCAHAIEIPFPDFTRTTRKAQDPLAILKRVITHAAHDLAKLHEGEFRELVEDLCDMPLPDLPTLLLQIRKEIRELGLPNSLALIGILDDMLKSIAPKKSRKNSRKSKA